MNMSFWQGRRVLLTGHTGFKGSWLALWLQRLGAQVTGYSLQPPTNPNLFTEARVAEGMTSIEGDVRDADDVHRVVQVHQPEVVFHLAAQPIVRTSYRAPLETFATNVMGTANILDAVRRHDSVRVAVCITSDKCYNNREWHWGYREDEALGGHDPYSGSKACAELVAATYRHAYFSAVDGPFVATARAGNVIGGGDWAADRLIPDIVRSFVAGQPVSIRYPRATRPWQHVLVPLSGYLLLAERMWDEGQGVADAWNFGPEEGDAQPVASIVETMADLWGNGAAWSIDSNAHPHEDCYLKLDCSKAHARLQWAPRLRLRKTLEWVVEWYRAWAEQQAMRDVTLDQIARYERLLGARPGEAPDATRASSWNAPALGQLTA
jgi:CDP-glucose 4,6-dehydratase